jgi:hypothetical protein
VLLRWINPKLFVLLRGIPDANGSNRPDCTMIAKTSEPTFALLVLPESTPASIYGLYEVFLSVGRTGNS